MATTSITITDEAYEYLKSIKGNRSFSQTILGLRNPDDIMRFAGALKHANLESVRRVRKDINKDWDDRHRHLFPD